ncbi:MAG: hypothetical protein R3D98_01175 [Candidatus Krumholzibacteriia bacterium]
MKFHPGVSFRHVLSLPGDWASADLDCAPPHDHVGEREEDPMPKARNDGAAATVERINEV